MELELSDEILLVNRDLKITNDFLSHDERYAYVITYIKYILIIFSNAFLFAKVHSAYVSRVVGDIYLFYKYSFISRSSYPSSPNMESFKFCINKLPFTGIYTCVMR